MSQLTPLGTKIQGRAIGIGTWQPVAATSGTDTACADLTNFYASIFVPGDCLVTGIKYLIGSVGGTDKVVVSLYNAGGQLLANSALAGATVGTAANSQSVAFTAPVLISGPDYFYIGLAFNGTTAKFRSVPAFCDAGSGLLAGSTVIASLVPASFVPSSTAFTADKGPIASLY